MYMWLILNVFELFLLVSIIFFSIMLVCLHNLILTFILKPNYLKHRYCIQL